jgi:peptidyl-prolyl cis-trans isomerase A (cyclophilin A)
MRQFLILSILFILFLSVWAQFLPQVEIQTSLGNINLEIDTIHAPETAKNFLAHVEKGTFKPAVFYRTVRQDNQPNSAIKIEVIQGGLFSDAEIEKHSGIRHETIRETGLKHLDGTISMARNEPGSASTEFFICMGNQPELDFGGRRNPDGQGFAAFGKVIKGMDVVRKIQQLPDENQYLKEPVKIISMGISESDISE